MKIKSILAVSAAALTALAGCQSVTGQLVPPAVQRDIIPLPVERTFTDSCFIYSASTKVMALEGPGKQAAGVLAGKVGFRESGDYLQPENYIVFSTDEKLPAEGYSLVISPEKIAVSASDPAGAFYAVQTLIQLMPAGVAAGKELEHPVSIPCQSITDYPRFGYRGFQLDVARTFSDKDVVLRLLDHMAIHKLNKFHWHLTDDEGWRLELDCFPELAHIGGFRGGDYPVQPIYGEWDKVYGGYFTKDDVREIVAYATERHIEVIPEVELPGHSRAAAKVMPGILCGVSDNAKPVKSDRRNVWCVAKEKNYEIIRKIIDEMAELFPGSILHIGGDEVSTTQWKSCPDCQRLMQREGYTDVKQLEDHFITRVTDMVLRAGKTPGAWDEATDRGKLTKEAVVWGWQHVAQCRESLKKGYKTLLLPGEYFYVDMKQSAWEPGLTWAGVVDAGKMYSFDTSKLGLDGPGSENIVGVEGTFFSELFLSNGPEYLDYQLFPRLCALSEVGWSPEEKREWDDFYRRLTVDHFPRLTALGIKYREFPARVELGFGDITAGVDYPGPRLHYTGNGRLPDRESDIYTDTISTAYPASYLFQPYGETSKGPVVQAMVRRSYDLPAGKTTVLELPIGAQTDFAGRWLLSAGCLDSNVKLKNVSVVDNGTTKNITSFTQRADPMHRFRFDHSGRDRSAVVKVTVTNENSFPCTLTMEAFPSPYIEPPVTVTSSMSQSTRFPFKNVQDYNFSTYSRTGITCKEGDHITFTFASPVDAASIEVATGLTYLPRYIIPVATVKVSTDGVNYTDVGKLAAGRCMIHPEGPIKSIRIISHSDGNGENAVAIQDLKIKPRR